MPRKKTKPTPLLAGRDFEIIDPDEQTTQEIMSEIIANAGPGDVTAKVFKIEGGARKFCQNIPYSSPSDIDEEVIGRLGYGSGDYSVSIIIDGVFQRAFKRSIAEKVIRENGGSDPTLKLMLDRLTSAVEKLNQPREREPIGDLTSALVQLHSLAPKPQGEMSVESMVKLITLGQEIGGGGRSDGWMDILKELAPSAVQAFLASRGQLPPVASPQMGALPAAQGGEMFDEVRFKLGVEFLKKKCLAGRDPLLYCDLIIDNRDEPEYQRLISRALSSDFATFVAIDPTINSQPFEQFFRKIYDGIRQAFSADDSMAGDPVGESGHDADVNSNGTTGKKRGKKS